MALFPRTLGVTNKLIEDVEKFLFKTTIVVQTIFFGYYGYSIYTNLNSWIYLTIFSMLLVLSTISFVYYLINHQNRKNRSVKTVKKSFRISKYVINGSMLALNIIEIVRNGGTEIAYMLFAFSTLSLLTQIVVEFIRIFINYYVELYRIALEKDAEKYHKYLDITDIKGHLVTLADVPFEALAKKIDAKKPVLSEKQLLVESLGNRVSEKANEKKRLRRQSKVEQQKNEIKEHLTVIKNKIFTKKESSDDKTSNEKKNNPDVKKK